MNDLKMGFKHTLLQRLQGLEMIIPQRSQSIEMHHQHHHHYQHYDQYRLNNNHHNQNERVSELNAQTVHVVTDFSIQKILGDNIKTGKSFHEKFDEPNAPIRIIKNIPAATLSPTPIKMTKPITETLKTVATTIETTIPYKSSIIATTTTTTTTTTTITTKILTTKSVTTMPATAAVTSATVTPTPTATATATATSTATASAAAHFQIIQPIAKKAFNNSDILDLSINKSTQYPYISASPTINHATNPYNYTQARVYEGFHPGSVLAAMAAVNAQKFYAQFLPQMFAAGFYTNGNSISNISNTSSNGSNISSNISSNINNNNYSSNGLLSHQNHLMPQSEVQTQQQPQPQHQPQLQPQSQPQTHSMPPSITANYSKRHFAPYIINPVPAQTTPSPTSVTLLTSNSTSPPTSSITSHSRVTAHDTNFFPPPLSSASHTPGNRSNRLNSCNRSNCLECLNAYYRCVSNTLNRYPLNSSIALPSNTNLNAAVTCANTCPNTSLYCTKMKSSKEATLITSLSVAATSIPSASPLASPTVITPDTMIRRTTTNPLQLNARSGLSLMPTSPPVLFHPTNPLPSNMEEISYKCCICEKVFGCSQTLQAHEKTHKSPRYECSDCGKGFSQLRNYKYHLSVHRGTKEFAAECPECRKTFNDKGYLSSHMKIHRNKKEYQCPYCPKSFNQRVAFNMHVRIHTGIKPHKCVECGKRFSRKMLLKQHMRTHSGEKPYQCSVCGKSFADRSNMTLHHRLHSGIKPFNCPICPKAFTKKHHLKTHLNYHTGCKPYVCPHPNCQQAFTQSSNMRTHAKKCQYRPLQLQYPTPGGFSVISKQSQHQSSPQTLSTISMNNGNVIVGQHATASITVKATTINNVGSSKNNNNNNNNNNIPVMASPNVLTAGIRMLNTITAASAASVAASATSLINVVAATTTTTAMPVVSFPSTQQPLLSTLRQY